MQKQWHPFGLLSHGYCAVANKLCCRHVLLSPHSTMADLMLWGSFSGHTFIGKRQKLWCFWTLSALLPTCCSAALFLLSWSGASQEHQMSLSEAHVCRPSVQQAQCTCACVYISDSQAKYPSGLSVSQPKPEKSGDASASVKSHLKECTFCLYKT